MARARRSGWRMAGRSARRRARSSSTSSSTRRSAAIWPVTPPMAACSPSCAIAWSAGCARPMTRCSAAPSPHRQAPRLPSRARSRPAAHEAAHAGSGGPHGAKRLLAKACRSVSLVEQVAARADSGRVMKISRFPTNPIIRPHMDRRMGDNINGPSLVRAPSWVERPLGRYYLYFGHHRGTYIRLAYADDLAGPWRTYEPGVLDLAGSHFVGHIASPDVHVDEARREVRLYYHGRLADEERAGPAGRYGGQATRVAVSSDGLHFTALPEVLGAPYLRVFRWGDWYYAIGMP